MPAAHPELTRDLHLLHGRRHVALAVSGGSDSMALLRLVCAWASGQTSAPRLSVLTVDHGLRTGSAAEARQVAAWAKALDLDHHTLHWTGSKPETGLQAKARKARYAMMAEWCRTAGADVIVTAHTFDDQAETVLMRLRRTTSPDSLSGIPQSGDWGGIAVLRPLLGVRRQALRDYLVQTGQSWIEDPSNDDPRFERVRVRARLKDDGAPDAGRLVSLAAAAARTAGLLERCAETWISLWLDETEAGLCLAPTAELQRLPLALQQRILAKIVRHYGGGRFSPEAGELRRLTEWLKSGPPRATLGGAVLGKRRERFWVAREAGRIAGGPVEVPGAGAVIWDGRFRIVAPEGSTVTASGDDPPELGEGIPVYARRAYPAVSTPPGRSGGVRITFLRLARS